MSVVDLAGRPAYVVQTNFTLSLYTLFYTNYTLTTFTTEIYIATTKTHRNRRLPPGRSWSVTMRQSTKLHVWYNSQGKGSSFALPSLEVRFLRSRSQFVSANGNNRGAAGVCGRRFFICFGLRLLTL